MGRIKLLQLAHVEDLHAVIVGLAPNDDVALVPLDLPPHGGQRAGVLGQAAQVDELALLADLGERRAVLLSDGDELASLAVGPAPGAGAETILAAELGMGLEVVEIQVLALEGILGVAGDVGGDAVLAGDEVLVLAEGGVLGRVEDALLVEFVPGFLRSVSSCHVSVV